MIYVVATFTIHPGTLEPFVEAAYAAIAATRREPGCLLYDLHASVTDPERAVLIARWESREALNMHMVSDHIAAFAAANRAYVASAEIEVIYPEKVETFHPAKFPPSTADR